MVSVSSYKMKRTSLSLQNLAAALTDLRRPHLTHANRGPRRPTMSAVDGFQNLTSMLKHWEKIVLITQRKDSDRRPAQGSYLAFFLFRERRRSVFARLSGCCRSRLYTFSHPYHFRDNHSTSETITQKFSFLGQFLLDFDKRTLDRKLPTSGLL